MTTLTRTKATTDAVAGRTSPLVSWGLMIGGVFFFIGGSLHPKEDPTGVTVKEHMRVMFADPLWYPSHATLLIGMVVLAAAFVILVRGRSLTTVPRAHTAAVVVAITTVIGAAAALLHLVAATDIDAITAGRSTPITDVELVVETITTPLFGLTIAALAVIGAMTRTLGNPVTAILGVVGGVSYAIAGGTILLTEKTDFLFPIASGIALWTIAVGIGLLLRRRAARSAG
jgi:hypothetical protein